MAASNWSAEQERVEEHAKTAERLSPPGRPEAEQNHVPIAQPYVERRGLPVQVFFTDQES